MELGSLSDQDLHVTFAVSVTAAAVALQHFFRRSGLFGGRPGEARFLLLRAGAGLILGLGAALGALLVGGEAPLIPLGLGSPVAALPVLLGAFALIFGGTLLLSRGAAFAREYPEAPLDPQVAGVWGRNAASWAVYLAGYELLFRGLCLNALVAELGLVPGVAITTALYVVAHLPKSLGESLGSFPMGVLFAYLTLSGQSVLYPWLLHVLMAVSADTLALRVRARHGAARTE